MSAEHQKLTLQSFTSSRYQRTHSRINHSFLTIVKSVHPRKRKLQNFLYSLLYTVSLRNPFRTQTDVLKATNIDHGRRSTLSKLLDQQLLWSSPVHSEYFKQHQQINPKCLYDVHQPESN